MLGGLYSIVFTKNLLIKGPDTHKKTRAAKSSRNYTTLNLSGWRRAVGCNNHFKSQLCKGCHSEVFQRVFIPSVGGKEPHYLGP